MPKLKLAAVPIESIPGDKPSNLQQIERWSRRGAESGAQIVCFPAMALTGYWETSEVAEQAEIVRAQAVNPALTHAVGPSVVHLEDLARRLAIHLTVGLVEDHDYYHLRNSVVVFSPVGIRGVAAQMHTPIALHPTYVGGRDCQVFDLHGIRAGVYSG